MKKENYLKISEVEKLTGIPRSTIHFYLREGLLHPPEKSGKTMAYYDESHLDRLKLIQQLKNEMGFPVKFIKKKIATHTPLENELENIRLRQADSNEALLPPKGPRDRRKNEIIEASLKIFAEKGFYKTKVKDITDAMDMSTGTFYIYFNNKEDLFLEAIDGVVKTMIGNAAQAMKNEKDYLMRLLVRAQVFFEQYSKYSEILNQLRAEMTKDSTWFQERVKGIYRDLTQPVIREFNEAMEQGLIRKIDPDLLAYAMTGLIETMSFRMTIDDAYSFDKIIVFLMDLIMNGLPVNMNPRQEKRIQKFLEEVRNKAL
ncbi:MAG: MerR family transcriptional regulator [Proteobacteria bacterium]|nr:MerR family transcriptional regulator [Pseudomonadota bacterium]